MEILRAQLPQRDDGAWSWLGRVSVPLTRLDSLFITFLDSFLFTLRKLFWKNVNRKCFNLGMRVVVVGAQHSTSTELLSSQSGEQHVMS